MSKNRYETCEHGAQSANVVVPFAELVGPVQFVAEGIIASVGAIAEVVTVSTDAMVRRWDHTKTVRELSSLPDSVLRDIGIDRGGIRSAVRDMERGIDPRDL